MLGSPQDTEALAALGKLRGALSQSGMNFSDLANALKSALKHF